MSSPCRRAESPTGYAAKWRPARAMKLAPRMNSQSPSECHSLSDIPSETPDLNVTYWVTFVLGGIEDSAAFALTSRAQYRRGQL